jgi:caffeoyl-CoA O-methyltransferase
MTASRGARKRLRRLRDRLRDLRRQTFPPVHPDIEEYLDELHGPAPEPVLREMDAYAVEQGFPAVGPIVGRFLETMARSVSARRVFEFGSGFGYSAIWFARAVGPAGAVIGSDGDADNCRLARQFLASAGVAERVVIHHGMADRVFADTDGEFDVCYNDVDKGDYPRIWELARERVRPGGLYIADNALWYGKVTMRAPRDFAPGWTEAIREHNAQIAADPDFDTFINPVRDGVIVARRLR